MIDPDKTHIILGPPGTGKTTELLRITEGLMDSGFSPAEIGFIAFTRKAAHEAMARAQVKFKLQPEQLPYFRTLHSLAFHQLGLSKNDVMGYGDYIKLSQELGITITFKGASEDGTITGLSKGDRLFFAENMARAQVLSLKDYWEKFPDEDVHWYELLRLYQTLKKYKHEYGKRDFTDMVIDFIKNPLVPPIRALILDEAQDLTPLQWRMVEKLAEDVEEVYIAGDDDQAIFKWAGADPDYLINLRGSRRVLPQSFRVPLFIQGLAETVVQRITNRIEKEWLPTKQSGAVEYVNELEQIDMSQGTWMLLARNVYLLQQYNDYCIQNGYVFSSHLGSPVKGASMDAILAWESLRRGETMRMQDVKGIYDLISVQSGGVTRGFKKVMDEAPDNADINMTQLRERYGLSTDKIWHESLDRIPEMEREYFIAALRRGEKLLREPRIRIETIHGVKGGEADNVVLCPDMADRTWREYEKAPDDEARVWYVGITRAKQKLYVLSPSTDRHYSI